MTKRPLATISFNTYQYVRQVCRDLLHSGDIVSYLYIRHKAEEDTKKPHIHLLLIPAKVLSPVSVRALFHEPVKGERDLGCLPFEPSKVGDWLLYCLHYPQYLIKKGLFRQYSYDLSEVQTNESIEYLQHIFNEARETVLDSRLSLFLDRVRRGDTFAEILASGTIPANQVLFYDKLYKGRHSLPKQKDELFEK